MLGTWRWNAAFGILGLGLTLLFSIGHNPLPVILLRGLYSAITFFVFAYGARAVLSFILKPPAMMNNIELQKEDVEKGQHLDMSTPDEKEELNDMLKEQLNRSSRNISHSEAARKAAGFRPLTPPAFVSTTSKQPAELANAIRHLTGE